MCYIENKGLMLAARRVRVAGLVLASTCMTDSVGEVCAAFRRRIHGIAEDVVVGVVRR